MILDDNTFIRQFEDRTLDPVNFNHLGHLRIAWLYLDRKGLDYAVNKSVSCIQEYANSLGATDKFHRTLTEATVKIMAERYNKANAGNFESFLKENEDLTNDLRSVLLTYYSDKVLDSDEARKCFISPDIASFSQ